MKAKNIYKIYYLHGIKKNVFVCDGNEAYGDSICILGEIGINRKV